MRIIYCLPEMSHPGGIARVTTIKANYLVNHGYEVLIVTTDQKGEPSYYNLDIRVRHIDFNINFDSYNNPHPFFKYIIRKRRIALFENLLKQEVKSWRPDIIISTFNNERDFLYKWKDGSKKILEFHFSHDTNKAIIKYSHCTLLQKCILWAKTKDQERLAKKYDAFVVLTHEDAETWKGYNNIHVIPNMLSFGSNETSDCKAKRVIVVGRLDFQKRFDRLIEIWENVHEKCSDWELNIFGKGPDNEHLEQLIKKYQLEQSVKILNPTHNIQEEYLRSSLFVMTSVYEGLPMTLLEAIECGLPCISFAFKCGPRDVIKNGETGYIIKEGDIEEFSKKIVFIIHNQELRIQMGKHAKGDSYHWSLETIMKRWVNLFEELVR